MTPRPRKRGNRDLPDNLYVTSTGYEYRHPLTKKRHGMGSDRARAIKSAKVLNQHLQPSTDLVARVLGGAAVKDVLQRFRAEYLPERKHSEATRKGIEQRLRRYERELGDTAWQALSLKRLSDWLQPLPGDSYRMHRIQWIEIFRFACAVGLSERNLAEATLKRAPIERKRKRWTLEQFKKVREQAEPWLQIAMDIAVLTLQRRADLVAMRWDNIKDGRLLVRQSKTGKRIAIRISGDLEQAMSRAKAQRLICPYIIARRPQRIVKRKSLHPFQVTEEMLTRAVANARDAAGCFGSYAPAELPTLHELRSLGAHLYRDAGYPEDYIQVLLGHSEERMTRHYLDGHREEWAEITADLRL